MFRGIHRLSALLVTVALLAGLPYAATAVLDWPALDWSYAGVLAYLRGGSLPPGLATAVLIAALWAAWGLYLLTLLAEILARLRGRPIRLRLRLLGPLQVLAATTIGATLTTPAAHATIPPAATPTSAEQPPSPPRAVSTEGSSAVGEELPDSTVHGGQVVQRSRTIDHFGYDSAELTPAMRQELRPTVEMIRDHGATDIAITVTGHTDTAGDADYNRTLSRRRAVATATYLSEQLTDRAPPIETRAMGEEHPIAGAEDAGQRRVEITYTVTTAPTSQPATPDEEPPSPSAEPAPTAAGANEQPAVALVLPSGVMLTLATGVGAAVGAASGATVASRRYAYKKDRQAPPWPGEDGQRQPPPVPASAAALSTDDAEEEAPTPDAVADPDSVGEQILVELSRTPGVGVTGPGATGAARAVLATALRPHAAPQSPRIVLCAPDAALVLGQETSTALQARHAPRVEVVSSPTVALTTLHAESVERQHRLHEAGVDTIADLRSTSPAASTTPPLVLITTAHQEHEADLAALLHATAELDITALVLGDWPAGNTLTISENGVITETSSSLAHVHGLRWPTVTPDTIAALLDEQPPATSPTPEVTQDASGPPPAAASEPDVSQPAGEALYVEAQAAAEAENASVPSSGEGSPAEADTLDEAPRSRDVRLHLLGRIRITVAGEPVELRRHSAYEVAAYLAVHPGGVRRDAAIEDMWPQDEPRRATRRFHDAVSTLRRLLRPVQGQDPPPLVIRDGDRYQLAAETVAVDLWEFTAALEASEQAAPGEQRHEQLRHVLALYAGDVAAEADYLWLEPLRVEIRTRLLRVLGDHAAQLAENAPAEAVTMLERAIALDPTLEDHHEALIRLHLAQDNTQAARRGYERYAQEMRRISTTPNPRLRELLEETPQKN
ncbi:OmpA family protein [Salinactinospora qingdaonensis]|uniref:OmpA-like domain-containing protein n=1 Tax=Salinactinospora qingdaonensis TaxID=702744 RepID=A0ABP7FV25_9ACTN